MGGASGHAPKAYEFMVDVLQHLVAIPSPSGQEGELARFVASVMRDLGFDEVFLDAEHNVLGRLRFGRGSRKVLFLVHSDTPHGGAGVLEEKRGQLRSDGGGGGIFAGPGVAAPKGAIACVLAAALEIAGRRAYGELRGEMGVAVVSKDLLANHDGPRALASHLEGYELAVVAEPSDNRIVKATRGIVRVRVEFEGRVHHCSLPDPDGNALYHLGELLGELRKLPAVEHPEFGPTGHNPIGVSVEVRLPMLPAKAALLVDKRLLPGDNGEAFVASIDSILRRMKDENGAVAAAAVVVSRVYPYSLGEETAAALEMLREIRKRATGCHEPEVAAPFGSNAGFLQWEMRIPTLVIGPGRLGDVGGEEFVEARKLVEAVQIYRDLALECLASRGEG